MVSSRLVHSTRSSITVIKGHGDSLVHILDTILTMLIPSSFHREHRCTSIPISSRASDGAITTSGYESFQRRSGRQADIIVFGHPGTLYLMSASSSRPLIRRRADKPKSRFGAPRPPCTSISWMMDDADHPFELYRDAAHPGSPPLVRESIRHVQFYLFSRPPDGRRRISIDIDIDININIDINTNHDPPDPDVEAIRCHISRRAPAPSGSVSYFRGSTRLYDSIVSRGAVTGDQVQVQVRSGQVS
jgi:hypothetical protein